MMSINGRRTVAKQNSMSEHPGPVSLNMVIGQKSNNNSNNSSGIATAVSAGRHYHQNRESNDTLSQLEQQVRSIEMNTKAAARLREGLTSQEPDDTYLRYREHEDLLGTINHEPER